MRIPKSKLFIFSAACVLSIIVAYLCSLFLRPADGNKFFVQFFTEGYNFRKLQSDDEDFVKYKVGDKIDLNKIISTDNNNFLSVAQENLLLLNIIDPLCGYCELSKDIIGETKKATEQTGIGYYPVLFTTAPETVNLKTYAQSIGFSDCYRWENNSKPPQLLISMPTPAHILVDRNGTILQVWFSSNNDAKIRKRMSDQISSDLYLINDVAKNLR